MQLRPVNFVFPPFQGKRPKQSVFLLVLTALAAGVAAGIALERFARGVRVLGVPQPGATSELVAAGMPPPSDLVGTAKQKMFIHVVFFAFVHGAPNVRRSLDLIHLQLGELRDWGLAAAATSVDVVLNGKMEYVFDASVERDLDAAAALIRSLVPRVRITKVPVNRFEYSGIRHVWDLAQEIPDKDAQSHVILYFHTKGLVFGDQTRPRNSWNKLLMEEVVRPWPKLVKRFASDRRLNKAGLLAHGRGWLWNTFFWVRWCPAQWTHQACMHLCAIAGAGSSHQAVSQTGRDSTSAPTCAPHN
jgi:hypothetical protein